MLIEVAAGLVFHHGKLLITQRPLDVPCGGLWEFPGGKRQPGESFESCLQREIREELGIEITVRDLLLSVRHEYPDQEVALEFYRCELRAGTPQTIGCTALAWVTGPELDQYQFPPADLELIARLRTDPAWWRDGTAFGRIADGQ